MSPSWYSLISLHLIRPVFQSTSLVLPIFPPLNQCFNATFMLTLWVTSLLSPLCVCLSLSLAILLLLSVIYLSRSVWRLTYLVALFYFLSYYYLSFWLNLFFPPFPSLIANLFFSPSLSPSFYSPSLVFSLRKRRCRQKIEETRSFGYFWTFRGSQLKRRKQKSSKTEEKFHLKIDEKKRNS